MDHLLLFPDITFFFFRSCLESGGGRGGDDEFCCSSSAWILFRKIIFSRKRGEGDPDIGKVTSWGVQKKNKVV